MHACFPTTTTSGAGNPLPMKTGDIEIVSGKQLSAEDLGQCELISINFGRGCLT